MKIAFGITFQNSFSNLTRRRFFKLLFWRKIIPVLKILWRIDKGWSKDDRMRWKPTSAIISWRNFKTILRLNVIIWNIPRSFRGRRWRTCNKIYTFRKLKKKKNTFKMCLYMPLLQVSSRPKRNSGRYGRSLNSFIPLQTSSKHSRTSFMVSQSALQACAKICLYARTYLFCQEEWKIRIRIYELASLFEVQVVILHYRFWIYTKCFESFMKSPITYT